MEDPVRDIKPIQYILTTAPLPQQHTLLSTLYTPNASLSHPLISLSSSNTLISSRDLLLTLYTARHHLLTSLSLDILSVAFDESAAKLYVTTTQRYRLRLMPWSERKVEVVSVMQLKAEREVERYSDTLKKEGERPVRWYIEGQTEWVREGELVPFTWVPGAKTALNVWRWMSVYWLLVWVLLIRLVGMVFGDAKKSGKRRRCNGSRLPDELEIGLGVGGRSTRNGDEDTLWALWG